jgi:fumarylacetoacetase
MRNGDLIATGTVSGPTPPEVACLLEATRNGAKAIETGAVEGEKLSRTFLEDGDTIVFYARTERQGGLGSVGFGRLAGEILPSK